MPLSLRFAARCRCRYSSYATFMPEDFAVTIRKFRHDDVACFQRRYASAHATPPLPPPFQARFSLRRHADAADFRRLMMPLRFSPPYFTRLRLRHAAVTLVFF